jgi:hypothetical protein
MGAQRYGIRAKENAIFTEQKTSFAHNVGQYVIEVTPPAKLYSGRPRGQKSRFGYLVFFSSTRNAQWSGRHQLNIIPIDMIYVK